MCKSNTQPKQNKTTINNVRPFPVLLVLIYQPCASFIFAGFIVLNSSVTRRGSRMKLMVAGIVYILIVCGGLGSSLCCEDKLTTLHTAEKSGTILQKNTCD